MKYLNNINFGQLCLHRALLRMNPSLQRTLFMVISLMCGGCSDFVEVDPPKNNLVSETVFKDPATVESALANLYYGMREQGMTSGSFGLTTALGIYADELDYYGFNADQMQLYNHNVIADNNLLLVWWEQAYSLIYAANDIIRGVESSKDLNIEGKKTFQGQALFVRAYLHSLLVSLFGDVPYITNTDYLTNNKVSRLAEEEVYVRIIEDLTEAMALLESIGSISEERVWPDSDAVKALLARMYLYTENWEMAAATSTELITDFPLEAELNHVFLKDSPETIWQLRADDDFPKNTREAGQLIIQTVPGQTYALTDEFLASFEVGDLRSDHWIGSATDAENGTTLYFAHKYKAGINETESLEYSILFRSAEQYLIRAESRAYLGNLVGAQNDLNAIRNRAGLSNTMANTMEGVLKAILQERKIELFTEQGHRWFDLKRTGNAGNELNGIKPNWQENHVLLPVPEDELEINPNMLPQNPGY